MQQDTFLTDYIKAIQILHPKEIFAIQNLNYEHLHCSPEYNNLFKYEPGLIGLRFVNSEEAEFKQLSNILSPVVNTSQKKVDQDNRTIRFILSWANSQGELLQIKPGCYLIEQSLIVNPINNHIAGWLIKVQELDISLLNQMLRSLNQLYEGPILIPTASALTKKIKGLELSEKEQEILFLLIIGKKYKSIANTLSRIYQTDIKETSISNLIHKRLYEKFEVTSIEKLVEKALNYSVIKNIPLNLIKLHEGVLSLEFIN